MNKLIAEIQNYLLNNSNKIKIDSNDIIKGDVFCALKGKNTHGRNYIGHAINNKAKYIITDNKKIKFESSYLNKVKSNIDQIYN